MPKTYFLARAIVELTTEEFQPIFEQMVKRYFDQYQKTAT
jgi:hypothetical protein